MKFLIFVLAAVTALKIDIIVKFQDDSLLHTAPSNPIEFIVNPYEFAGSYDVWDSINLEDYDLPDSTLQIEKCAFYSTSGVTSIIFPKNLVYVGDSAFSNSTVRDVTFLGSNATVSRTAFDSLDSIMFQCPTYLISVICNELDWYDTYTSLSACSIRLASDLFRPGSFLWNNGSPTSNSVKNVNVVPRSAPDQPLVSVPRFAAP